MKNSAEWLNTNKISLNVQKTEMVIFKHQIQKLDGDTEIKMSRKLYHWQSVKYLGIKINKYLNGKHHVNDIAVSLNRVNAPLFRIANFVNIDALKIIYSAVFASHTDYENLI